MKVTTTLLALVWAATAPAQMKYVVRAGETVELELSSSVGKVLESHTMPVIQHAPFATTDAEGRFVIAVPLLTPPGEYSVSVAVHDDRGIAHPALVSLSVQPVTPVPLGVIPVILLNGYQTFLSDPLQFSSCPVSTVQGTFGGLPAALNQTGVSYFFDNCADCPNCQIESLGADLGAFLNLLKYTDGTPVPQADVVAHSMGGLIVRAFLSGKQIASGSFVPPANPKIRKAIFIGTPHFGSFVATLLDAGNQAIEMTSGSQFLWDLNRWNQGFDDLRNVDAIAIAGNGTATGQSDGVVDVTSASLTYATADLCTRVIYGCHIPPSFGILSICASTDGIAQSPDSIDIVTSFLGGTNTWTTIGHPPSQDPYLAHNGGRIIAYATANNLLQAVTNMTFGQAMLSENHDTRNTYYNDGLAASSGTLAFTWQSNAMKTNLSIPAGGYGTTLIKNPPMMTYVGPAAAQLNTLNIAPGSLISIFGVGLAASTASASFPWPTKLADATVTANGQSLQLLYAGSGQITAYFPSTLSGLVTLQLTNSLGQHSLNVMTTNASPAIFSADGSGTGLAAAIHAATGQYVTQSNPATAGEYIEIYGTGFGSTFPSGGLNVTALTPTLSIGNTTAKVSFSGMPQGAIGLYQINLVVPAGLPPGNVPMSLSMGGHLSNAVMLTVH